MSQYKNTLNLPQTDFPMKANLAEREPLILKKWQELNLYQELRKLGKKRKKFIFLDGPPYANAHIHMGTAVNKILKDMVVKYKTLSGFDTPFIPGWDCHGLPIELNVEKKVGKPGKKITPSKFRQACREYALTQIQFQLEEFKRLGVIADFEKPYLTMDYSYEANTVRSLAKIFKNGHILQGAKPIYWCLDCASALADAEVEYQDKISSAIDVHFKVVDPTSFLKHFNIAENHFSFISVPIWTTTPWTLPANQAVILHPDIEYALVRTQTGEGMLVAAPLVSQVMGRFNFSNYTVLASTVGKNLEHSLLSHPFYTREVPIILAEFVTVESGTGAVHCAGAHGLDDYAAANRYQLPMLNLLGNDGCFTADAEFLQGVHVNKAGDRILEELKIRNALITVNTFSHSYPHCWRHKTPLIFRATPQWFISMDKENLRAEVLSLIEKVNFIPDWGMARIYSMIENRPDWCISRQRYWGTPIPIFIHKETQAPHPDTVNLMEKVATIIEKEGIEGWFKVTPETLLGADANNYYKCQDILDVWFDSGVAHECVLRHEEDLTFPADLFLEGSDQHRGWFNSSLVTSVAMNGKAPYKTVLTHGYVIDLHGRKMSKSLGNVIAPETIIKTFGADVLRLWAASLDYRGDIFVSDEILTRISETYRRIRNTARFLLANIAGFSPEKDKIPFKKMLALDRWVIDRARNLQQEILEAYESYQFHVIYQKIQNFCTVDLGGFYLDIIKDRQYTTQKESVARRSTQTAMFHLIEAMVRWLAPILTFTAEEIWQHLPGKRPPSVLLTTWYEELTALKVDEPMNPDFWDKIRLVRNAVNKEIEQYRNQGKLGAPLEAAVSLYCDKDLKQQLDILGDELRFILITSEASVHVHAAKEDASVTDVPDLSLRIEVLTAYPKCERCWHRRREVGENATHPTLCARCIVNVEGPGEVRKYA